MRPEKETTRTDAILELLNYHPRIMAWENPTTGTYNLKLKAHIPVKKSARRGKSDILLIVSPNGQAGALEVKTEKGRDDYLRYTTPGFRPTAKNHRHYIHALEQKKFLDDIEKHGGIAGLVTGITETRELLREHGIDI